MQIALLSKIFFRLFETRETNWAKWIISNYDFNLCQRDVSNTRNLSPLMSTVFKAVHRIKGAISFSNDGLIWTLTPSKKYSTRSALSLLRSDFTPNHHSNQDLLWSYLWKLKIIPKIKCFLWKLTNHGIPTKQRLVSRSWGGDPFCDYCHTKVENNLHVFFKCSYSSTIWNKI